MRVVCHDQVDKFSTKFCYSYRTVNQLQEIMKNAF